MRSVTQLVLAVGLLCVFSSSSCEAVTCYVCTGCIDPFDSAAYPTTTTCPNSCSKIKTVISGVQSVSRSCGGGTTDTCDTLSEGGVDYWTCECTSDKCNSADSLSVNRLFLATLGLLTAAVIQYKL